MELIEKITLLSQKQQEELLALVDEWLEEEIDEIETISPPKHTLYPIKTEYSVKDIKAIVKLFSKSKKWTCEDLENEAIFPPDLKVKIQLLNYKIYIMPRPTSTYQEILTNISTYMNLFVRQNKLGKVYVAPFGVHISESTCLEPDIVMVLKPKVEKVTEKGIFEAPSLVVEVISRSNYKKLREEKKQKYAEFGVPEYWEIYPNKKKINIEVLEENEEGEKAYTLYSTAKKEGKVKSKVIESFELDVKDAFEMEE